MKGEFLIEDVFTITGRGFVFTGRIKSGNVSTGDSLLIDDKSFPIKGVEGFRKMFANMPGDNVGLLIGTPEGTTKEDLKKYKGMVAIIIDIPTIREEKINEILK